MNDKITDQFKVILDDLGIKYSKVLMFGSRARGDYGEESDWDFMVVLEEAIDAKTKKELWSKIYKKFHECFPFLSVDIILKDSSSFEEEKKLVNTLSNEVYLEGTEI